MVEPRDVILKVTGSTVCGSDLHLLHGSVIQMRKGDILGHEFCGVVDSMGPEVKNLKAGDRVVASFQIACGECSYCQKKQSSQCERTAANSIENGMYGGGTAGMFGYSHFTGGFAGGQAEYVRVPLGDVNLLKLPEDVPDEKGKHATHEYIHKLLTIIQVSTSPTSSPPHGTAWSTRALTRATSSPFGVPDPSAKCARNLRS